MRQQVFLNVSLQLFHENVNTQKILSGQPKGSERKGKEKGKERGELDESYMPQVHQPNK